MYDIEIDISQYYLQHYFQQGYPIKESDWFNDMVQWCKDNLEPYAADFIDIQHGYVLFECEEDAMAFKLGWL